MSDYTIVEKYQQGKNPTIAVRPFFSAGKENMMEYTMKKI